MNKIVPWVDVTCSRCGEIATGSGFYYRGIIGVLERNIKDWKTIEGSVLCPRCYINYMEEKEDMR